MKKQKSELYLAIQSLIEEANPNLQLGEKSKQGVMKVVYKKITQYDNSKRIST